MSYFFIEKYASFVLFYFCRMKKINQHKTFYVEQYYFVNPMKNAEIKCSLNLEIFKIKNMN